jgi:hypothetical protein
MVNLYNRIQGRSLERLAAQSDGIFAVGQHCGDCAGAFELCAGTASERQLVFQTRVITGATVGR